MQSNSNFNPINLYGRIDLLSDNLNKFRLSKCYYEGFYTLCDKTKIKGNGIFIPSMCNLTIDTIDVIMSVYKSSFKKIIDLDFLLYFSDENDLFEGIWIPIEAICKKFKMSVMEFESKNVDLDFLKSNNIIKSYDCFNRIVGPNDIRMLKINGEHDIIVHELLHGIEFNMEEERTFFLGRVKLTNQSINPKIFTKDVLAKTKGIKISFVEIGKNMGVVNFHIKNTISNKKFGKHLYMDYDKPDIYVKNMSSKGVFLRHEELISLASKIDFKVQPFVKKVCGSKYELIRILEGTVKSKSKVCNKHIMKGYETFFENQIKEIKYMSPIFLTSCSDSTLWSL
jgi:hypothetical protein